MGDLRADAANNGVTDIDALLAARPQPYAAAGSFELHRIGDAVASRNAATSTWRSSTPSGSPS
jgi:hypothetical protein